QPLALRGHPPAIIQKCYLQWNSHEIIVNDNLEILYVRTPYYTLRRRGLLLLFLVHIFAFMY
ncbi:MAG: hypothetical protein K6C10_05055, partial [Prevotella sp.]|nr:hypothetical protein [Prevotella sp.]